MSIEVTSSVEIKRPLALVAAFTVDPANMPQWNDRVKTAQVVTTGPFTVGTRFVADLVFNNSDATHTYEIYKYSPPHQYAFRAIDAAVPHRSEYQFEEVGHGVTRVTLTDAVEPSGLAGLLSGRVKKKLAAEHAANFERLRERLGG